MQGHLPGPTPHEPIGVGPLIGYLATRQPNPLEDRTPESRQWWEDEDEEWGPRHHRVIKVVALVLALSLAVAGMSTVLELVLTSH
jgi:hypothetical protein